MATRYRYTGRGAYIPGIPARDITDDDLKDLPAEALTALKESASRKPEEGGLYESVTDGAPADDEPLDPPATKKARR